MDDARSEFLAPTMFPAVKSRRGGRLRLILLVRVDSNNVHVYSLRSDSWKVVQGFPYSGGFSKPLSSLGTLLNGAIHWVCLNKDRKQPFMVAAFDLVEEKFREVPSPAPPTYSILELIEGCLCIRKCPSNEFWIMKQSWTKFGINIPFYHDIDLLSLLKNDEVLILKNSEKLVLYNTRERTHRDLRFHDIRHGLILLLNLQIFVESLISPSLKCEPEPIWLTNEILDEGSFVGGCRFHGSPIAAFFT
ncbi:F-box/kelch-repeat protein At3g06240-like [Cornus florida]|uniref:F-box/kelch-repeat protein At3g06240-like n=1 Tax=Cornus florida TaxID=4283 RepID=UPI00289B908A|nr:F-box/kelch-repeat protein At3g06240-like [Cornus florida]